jgi:HSP20 family molecular chaperone IbpA
MAEQDPDWMWQRARALLEQSERLRQRLEASPRPGAQPSAWEPPVDIFETEAEFWVLVALPGIEAPNVQVWLRGQELTVTGQRPLPEVLRNAQVHRLEIPYGRFQRQLMLPAGVYALGVTQMVQGLVVLQVHKRGPAPLHP